MNEKKMHSLRNDAYKTVQEILQMSPKGKTIPAHLPWKIVDIVLKRMGLMCKFKECDNVARSRGFCSRHYQHLFVRVHKLSDEGIKNACD